jgi:hypothetical protein
MNNAELEALLRRARPPEISEESLAMFPRRVLAGLDRQAAPRRAERPFFSRLAWAGGLAACLLMTVAVSRWHERKSAQAAPSSDILASAKLVHGMLAMFPNRVRAIVEDARGVNFVLSDGNQVPVSQPLYLRICDGRHCSSIVTFSGQEIQVAGQTVTALSDARDGIIVTGRQFVWCGTNGLDADAPFQIEAKVLAAGAM